MPPTPKRYLNLGRRLRVLMERERMNQPVLAQKAELSPSYPSKMLAGEVRPSLEVLRRIAAALHADIDELAELAGYSTVPNDERPELPGWSRLREVDQQHIRQMVEHMAELNARAEGVSDGRPGRGASSRGASAR